MPVGQDYEISINGTVYVFKTRQAAQAYVRRYVRKQTQRMKGEYLRQVYEKEAPCRLLALDEEESFGTGNPGDYGDST